MKFSSRLLLLCLLLVAAAPHARAHVGSKDVYEDLSAGPYKLFITVRMPNVIPGVAQVEVRATGATPSEIEITPTPLVGEAARHPPTPDRMENSPNDPTFYTGSLWMMAPGSWQVRFHIAGAAGDQAASVPVPANAITTLKMDPKLGVLLALLGLFLVVSMAGTVAAAVTEARVPPGQALSPLRSQRAVFAGLAALGAMGLMVWGGSAWWQVEAANFAESIYRPPMVHASLEGDELHLHVDTASAPDLWENPLKTELLPDHGKLMHLYAIRQPAMDAAYHLHPTQVDAADFRMALPSMPPGEYRLYGDVVHRNGFPETLVASITVPPGIAGGPLAVDDAAAHPEPLGPGLLGSDFKLPDGYTMHWDAPPAISANRAYAFRFTLLDPRGTPATDVVPYLGMAGHAAFVKTDGTVFAHTHPEGSAAMPALMLAQAGADGMAASMPSEEGRPLPPTVQFPYGFPSPGRYRIFVQMKHGASVETGVFDAEVKPGQ